MFADYNKVLHWNQRNLLATLVHPEGFTVYKEGKTPVQFDAVSPDSITMPALVQQELPFNVASNNYIFNFAGIGAPAPTDVLNNVRMGNSDILGFFAIRLLYGIGADRNNRVYRSRGINDDDNSLYSGEMTVEFESNKPIFNLTTDQFLNESDEGINQAAGLTFLTGTRIVSGYLANFKVTITLPVISTLTITDDSFIKLQLIGGISRPG